MFLGSDFCRYWNMKITYCSGVAAGISALLWCMCVVELSMTKVRYRVTSCNMWFEDNTLDQGTWLSCQLHIQEIYKIDFRHSFHSLQ